MTRPGRPEQPLAVTVGPFAELAGELRRLRGTRTYRELADMTGLSVATLRAAAAGGQVPTWRVTRAFADACEGSEHTVRGLWEEACAAAGRAVPAAATASAPAVAPVPCAGEMTGAADLVEMMKRLRLWAGSPSLAELNRRAGGFVLPTSTVSEALRSRRLPRRELVVAFVRACGLDRDQVAAWAAAWAEIQKRELADELPLPEVQPDSPPAGVWAQAGRAACAVLAWVSGVRPQVRTTGAGRGMSAGLGAAIVMTSVLAALAAAGALRVAAAAAWPAAILLGAAGGVVMMFLDRTLMTRIRRSCARRNLLVTVPRVLLSLLIGLVMATVAVMSIFAPEIAARAPGTDRFSQPLAAAAMNQILEINREASAREPPSTAHHRAGLRPALPHAPRTVLVPTAIYISRPLAAALQPLKMGREAVALRARSVTDQALTQQLAAWPRATSARLWLVSGNAIPNFAGEFYGLQFSSRGPVQVGPLDATGRGRKDRIWTVVYSSPGIPGLRVRLDAVVQVTSHSPVAIATEVLLFLMLALIGCLPLIIRTRYTAPG